jgi:hypothetical protein
MEMITQQRKAEDTRLRSERHKRTAPPSRAATGIAHETVSRVSQGDIELKLVYCRFQD